MTTMMETIETKVNTTEIEWLSYNAQRIYKYLELCINDQGKDSVGVTYKQIQRFTRTPYSVVHKKLKELKDKGYIIWNSKPCHANEYTLLKPIKKDMPYKNPNLSHSITPTFLTENEGISKGALRLYNYLSWLHNKFGLSCPSQDTICKKQKIEKETLKEYLKELKDKNYITWSIRYYKGQFVNVYTFYK